MSWLGLDKHFLVFPISRNTILNVVAFVSAARGDEKESWSAVGDRSELAGHFTSFDPVVKRIVSLMPRHPSKWVLNDREPLEQWVFASGHVVLAGDAAHAVSNYCTCPHVHDLGSLTGTRRCSLTKVTLRCHRLGSRGSWC